jgi:hypothetical protein
VKDCEHRVPGRAAVPLNWGVAADTRRLWPGPLSPTTRASEGSNVLGFVALASGADVELDLLALVEGLVTVALDSGEVNEHVLSALA